MPALAPAWHTHGLVGVLLLAPLTSLLAGVRPAPNLAADTQIALVYLPLLLANAGFVFYVTRLGVGRNLFWDLFGEGWRKPKQALADVAWGLGLALLISCLDAALERVLGWPESLASHALLPQSTTAKLCWLAVALGVASTEELVYRGYLQRQFAALSGSVAAGIVVQALLFGIAHGEQGPITVLRFAGYGLGFGWLAQRRRGLPAVVLCHLSLDLYAGLGA